MLSQETPLFERTQKIGWGWKADKENTTLENTCLTLETLVRIGTENENISLPLLVNNAQWLISQQQDDGSWDYGLTSRVAHALIKFYGKIKDDPLFETSKEVD